MKKFLIPAIALAAASVAVPAMAQNYQGQDRGRYEQDMTAATAMSGTTAAAGSRSPSANTSWTAGSTRVCAIAS